MFITGWMGSGFDGVHHQQQQHNYHPPSYKWYSIGTNNVGWVVWWKSTMQWRLKEFAEKGATDQSWNFMF